MAKQASFKPADLKFENKTSVLKFVYSHGLTLRPVHNKPNNYYDHAFIYILIQKGVVS